MFHAVEYDRYQLLQHIVFHPSYDDTIKNSPTSKGHTVLSTLNLSRIRNKDAMLRLLNKDISRVPLVDVSINTELASRSKSTDNEVSRLNTNEAGRLKRHNLGNITKE